MGCEWGWAVGGWDDVDDAAGQSGDVDAGGDDVGECGGGGTEHGGVGAWDGFGECGWDADEHGELGVGATELLYCVGGFCGVDGDGFYCGEFDVIGSNVGGGADADGDGDADAVWEAPD